MMTHTFRFPLVSISYCLRTDIFRISFLWIVFFITVIAIFSGTTIAQMLLKLELVHAQQA